MTMVLPDEKQDCRCHEKSNNTGGEEEEEKKEPGRELETSLSIAIENIF